jgi:hypothetical protein
MRPARILTPAGLVVLAAAAMPGRAQSGRVSSHSKVQPNKDGSLTIWFADKQPEGVPQTNWNWLPTAAGQNYHLVFRFYGPRDSIVSGQYFPPPLVSKN